REAVRTIVAIHTSAIVTTRPARTATLLRSIDTPLPIETDQVGCRRLPPKLAGESRDLPPVVGAVVHDMPKDLPERVFVLAAAESAVSQALVKTLLRKPREQSSLAILHVRPDGAKLAEAVVHPLGREPFRRASVPAPQPDPIGAGHVGDRRLNRREAPTQHPVQLFRIEGRYGVQHVPIRPSAKGEKLLDVLEHGGAGGQAAWSRAEVQCPQRIAWIGTGN